MTSLHIGGSVNIHESGLISFLKSSNASKLNELNISGLPVNDTTLTLLLKHCPQLTKLGVNFGHISESAMRAFLSTELGSRLEALHLAWVGTQSSTTGMVESSSPEKDPYSTDFFSDFLATTCPLLTELDVSGMKGANASSLQLYLDQRWRQVSTIILCIIYPCIYIDTELYTIIYPLIYKFIDISQVDISGGVTPNLQQLKAKYVGSSRGVLEQLLLQYNITRVEL